MAISIIQFLNIMLAALLAGTSFGIWMGFNPINLSPSTYVEQQQNTIRELNLLMIFLVIPATLVTIVSAILQKNNKQVFVGLLVAAAFFAVCMVISRFGNQPINDSTMTWNPASIPGNWTILRDKWWSFHIMRTIFELMALILITWTGIRKGNSENASRPYFIPVEKN
jgi:predicted membrane channel-forming protein YqfA (hemolysin III family)